MEVLEYLIDKSENDNERNTYLETLENLHRWNDTYISVCNQYEISHLMKDCCYLYREEDVYCINDVIRKRRKMLKMTMTNLSEGICSERTIRRLERRECKALEGIVDELFCKLGMSSEYANMGIVTENRDDVELYEIYRRAINANEVSKAEEAVEKLEKILPEYSCNKQVLLEAKSVIKWSKGELSSEQQIENLKEILCCTIDINDIKSDYKSMHLSWLEISCINSMAVAMARLKDYHGAKEKMLVILEYFKYFEESKLEYAIIGLYEMVMSFYASLIGSMREFDESMDILSKLNKLLLKLRRTNLLHYNEYNIAWNNKELSKSDKFNREDIEKCVNLCQLTRNKHYETSYLSRLK